MWLVTGNSSSAGLGWCHSAAQQTPGVSGPVPGEGPDPLPARQAVGDPAGGVTSRCHQEVTKLENRGTDSNR